MKKNYPDMRILDETDKYFIGHIYEDAYLVEKSSGQEVLHDDFYGDPKCGLMVDRSGRISNLFIANLHRFLDLKVSLDL